MSTENELSRSVLPIPDIPPAGLTTYDARDPDTTYPEQTEAFLFSADETCDVGDEFGSPVTTDYGQRKFSGDVNRVEIDLGLDDHNHLIAPEDRVNLAMAFQ